MNVRYSMEDLLSLMARLREPEYGCPWDLAQSYKTIVASTLEEAYEVVDAIENGDLQQLKEELGDLLFQVVFYSQLGKEDQAFNFHDVVHGITEKLLRRHPHVFPEGTLNSRINLDEQAENPREHQIKANWETIKKQERQQKGQQSIMDDVPPALPASDRAYKIQKRAASIGFDWPDTNGVYQKLAEELQELQTATKATNPESIEEELGDLLFTVVNLARHLKVSPETALRRANTKFEQRFQAMETIALQQQQHLSDQTPASLEALWQAAKALVRAK